MKNLKGFAESPRPLGPDFLTWPPPGSKLPVNWKRLLASIWLNLSWKANPPIRDGPGVARAARIVTSTKLSNRPIGPTIHSQDCVSAGKDEAMESSLSCLSGDINSL
jgi:hypothetical protein